MVQIRLDSPGSGSETHFRILLPAFNLFERIKKTLIVTAAQF